MGTAATTVAAVGTPARTTANEAIDSEVVEFRPDLSYFPTN